MNAILRYTLLLPALFLMLVTAYSCEEIGPDISTKDTVVDDTTYVAAVEAPQQKKVLIEEFTGVRCVNCPEGHALLYDLEDQYPGRIVAVSMHSNFLAAPHGDDQDLRTQEANQVEAFLGGVLGKPSAAIDRKMFSSSQQLIESTTKWAGFVDQQIQGSSPVNISVEADADEANREVTVRVTLHYTENVTEENKVSVMVLEDSIITKQTADGGYIDNYVQNHVLRTMLTSFDGQTLTETKEPGRTIIKTFQLDAAPAEWVLDNLSAIVFVHRAGSDKLVLQAAKDEVDL